jgi:CHAT domain-containing protein
MEKVDQKAAFIYPIILENRLEVIFKLPGQPLRHHTSPVKRPEVEKTLTELRTALLKGNGGKVIENSKLVDHWLIEPIEKYLETSRQVETLVFVLDGDLRNIPMAVLYDEKADQYLIQKKYALVLLPSSRLFDLRALPEKLKVLAAGLSEEIKVGNRRFKALSITQELEQVKNTASGKILLNSEFTQPNIQQNINSGNFSAIHLATHGNFSSDPDETYILVHGSEASTGRLLKARDLDDLLQSSNQKASSTLELLVLSACQTAEGDNRATLGLAGLAVRAGARSTLATLWQVSDQSTVQLMEHFYQELNKPGVTKAEAIHRAQQALLNEPKYQNPSYWAPYVLVGNWL